MEATNLIPIYKALSKEERSKFMLLVAEIEKPIIKTKVKAKDKYNFTKKYAIDYLLKNHFKTTKS